MENSEYGTKWKLGTALEQEDEDLIIQALKTHMTDYENDIELEAFGIGSLGAIRLASALRNGNLPHISTMHLNDNQIEKDGIIAIAEALPHCSISTLNLGYNDIGNEGAIAIANALKHENCQLTNLELLSSNISKGGSDELLKALTVNIQLENLQLFPSDSILSDEDSTLKYSLDYKTELNRMIKHFFNEYKIMSGINDKYDAPYHSTINNIEELSKFINFMSDQFDLANNLLKTGKNPLELFLKIREKKKWIPFCKKKIKKRILFLKRNKTVAQLDRRVYNALDNYVQQQIDGLAEAINDIQLRLDELSKQQMQMRTTSSSHHQSSSSPSSSNKRTFSKIGQANVKK